MKWSLQQLIKHNRKPFDFEMELDLKNFIEPIDDIFDISTVIVQGFGQNIREDRFLFKFSIQTVLTVEDARTLEPIPFPLNLEAIEMFDFDNSDDEDVRIIEKNTIDLTDAIWEHILLSKPMRLVKDELPE